MAAGTADAQLVINEILADPASDTDCAGFGAPIPATLCGDANGDGTADSSDDEFVEIYNTGIVSVDLTGYTIEDGVGLRHTFPSTVLNPNQAVVVFGGGTPTGTFGGGVVQTASEGGLALNNTGDSVVLKDDLAATVTSHTYGTEGGNSQSLTRNPDISGSFAEHFTASGDQSLSSPGTLVDGTVLPVELVSFDAVVKARDVILKWEVASETDNAGFEIEQASGREGFHRIAYVQGYGTTLEPQSYSYRVNRLDPGLHRFRLRQLDLDGSISYSHVVEAAVSVPGRFLIEPAYPNPFNPSTVVRFATPVEQPVLVTLVNVMGRVVRTLFSGIVPAHEMRELRIDAGDLPSGTYVIEFRANGLSESRSIVVAK